MLFAGSALVAFMFGAVDPAWALPVNSFLLVVLAVINMRQGRKISQAHRAAQDAKRAAGANRRSDRLPDTGLRRRWDDH